jgi:hypothetical protein
MVPSMYSIDDGRVEAHSQGLDCRFSGVHPDRRGFNVSMFKTATV